MIFELSAISLFWDFLCKIYVRMFHHSWSVRAMAINATFNIISVISWRSGSLVIETRETHGPAANHLQTLSYNCIEYTSPWAGFELITLVVIDTDCIGTMWSRPPRWSPIIVKHSPLIIRHPMSSLLLSQIDIKVIVKWRHQLCMFITLYSIP